MRSCKGWGVFWVRPGIPNVVRACPGCPDCRNNPAARRAAARAKKEAKERKWKSS